MRCAPLLAWIGLWVLLGAAAAGPADARPAHELRGQETQLRFALLTERLQAAQARLAEQLEGVEPELHRRLLETAADPLRSGYQRLPDVLPDTPVRPEHMRVESAAFSWPLTLDFIEKEILRVETRLAKPTAAVPAQPESQRRAAYEKLVAEYETREKRHDLIDRKIQHNRLWQPIIHGRRSQYAEATELYEAVLERDTLLQTLEKVDGPEAVALRAREQALRERIQAASRPPDRRDFIRAEQVEPGAWTFDLKVYTDIPDADFLARFQEAVESYWQLRDGDESFRIRITLVPIEPDALYAPGEPPAPGEPVALASHVARFPRDGGAISTGAQTIHAKGPRCIVLSAAGVKPRTLAHEFGHILGFKDEYVRGYRDLGEEGYEILEVVPAPENLMASPGHGRVHRYHFDALLDRYAGSDPNTAGGRASLPPPGRPEEPERRSR